MYGRPTFARRVFGTRGFILGEFDELWDCRRTEQQHGVAQGIGQLFSGASKFNEGLSSHCALHVGHLSRTPASVQHRKLASRRHSFGRRKAPQYAFNGDALEPIARTVGKRVSDTRATPFKWRPSLG